VDTKETQKIQNILSDTTGTTDYTRRCLQSAKAMKEMHKRRTEEQDQHGFQLLLKCIERCPDSVQQEGAWSTSGPHARDNFETSKEYISFLFVSLISFHFISRPRNYSKVYHRGSQPTRFALFVHDREPPEIPHTVIISQTQKAAKAQPVSTCCLRPARFFSRSRLQS
jgi:hypothetical protein